jgi:hypothetical protein
VTNIYAYVGGNPVSFADAKGLKPAMSAPTALAPAIPPQMNSIVPDNNPAGSQGGDICLLETCKLIQTIAGPTLKTCVYQCTLGSLQFRDIHPLLACKPVINRF